jgi:thiosulfate/3-mercaptopyruvate sulfurtransferase
MTATLILPLALVLATEDSVYSRKDLLVEPGQLKALADEGQPLVLLDTRGKGQYRDGHVPGAVWLDITTWGRAFKDGDQVDAWAKRIGDLGLDPRQRIVLYGDKLNETSRAWWILRYWGFEDVRLLHGGWKAWLTLGLEPERKENRPTPTSPKLTPQRQRLATKAEILELLKGDPFQLIDARTAEEHCGKAETAKRNGAIPGARNLDWTDMIDADTGRFKSAAELNRLFRAIGIDLKKPTIAHCQSGGRSSVTAFTLELLGATDVKNYYRSWAEWGNEEDTPIIVPKK